MKQQLLSLVSLSALTALLQGHIDGDALFFSRSLTISGNTEAVLALRNAVDASEVDLNEEIKAAAGPLAGLGDYFSKLVTRVWRQAEVDLTTIANSITAKQTKQLKSQQAAIETLQKKVATLSKRDARKHSSKKMVSA